MVSWKHKPEKILCTLKLPMACIMLRVKPNFLLDSLPHLFTSYMALCHLILTLLLSQPNHQAPLALNSRSSFLKYPKFIPDTKSLQLLLLWPGTAPPGHPWALHCYLFMHRALFKCHLSSESFSDHLKDLPPSKITLLVYCLFPSLEVQLHESSNLACLVHWHIPST